MGSALALASLLKRLGKKVTIANEGGIPKAFRFFPKVAPVCGSPRSNVRSQVSMIVDVPVLSRTGSIEKLIAKADLVVNIDHHVSNQYFADVNWVDPKAAAAGEMVYRLYRALHMTPTKPEALCLYTALVTDTGSFRYMSTTPAVHRIASHLIEIGVDPLKIAQRLYENHAPSDLRFLGVVLQGMRHTPDGKVAWLEIPRKLLQKHRAGSEVVDELVNYPRSVASAEVAFVLKEAPQPGTIRVSFRSKGRVDVNAVAKHFDGGGHIAASGCTIHGTLAQARRRVLRVVRQALQKRTRRAASY